MLESLLSPPILFFFLGMLAVSVRSDLEIPQPLPKLFSLYLLISIGFKGGMELSHSTFNYEIFSTLGLSFIMAFLTPIWVFFLLRKRLGIFDAAALAATYGSISAVTFITAGSYLDSLNITYGGHLVAAMALMESPAIIMAVLLVNNYARQQEEKISWIHLLKDSFTNASVFLILGSMLIGWLSNAQGQQKIAPFISEIFTGMLTFFLLDMGMLAAKRLRSLRKAGLGIALMGIVIPMINSILAIGIAAFFQFSEGNAFMFTILCASASYIAVPAAVRIAIPEASPGLYVPMSLAITFPFNIIVGIPLYHYLTQQFLF